MQVDMPLLHQQPQHQQAVSATSEGCLTQEGIESLARQHLKYSCEEEAPVRQSLLRRAFTAPPTLLSFFKPVVTSSTKIKMEGGSLIGPSPSLLPLSPYSRGQSSRKYTGAQRSVASFLTVQSPQPQKVVLLDDDSQSSVCVTSPLMESQKSPDPPGGTSHEGEHTPCSSSECPAESQSAGSTESDSFYSAAAPVGQEQLCMPAVEQAPQDANPSSAGLRPESQGSVLVSQVSGSIVTECEAWTPTRGGSDAKGGCSSHRPRSKKEAEWGADPCTSPIPTSESTSSTPDEWHRGRPSKRKSAHGMSTCEAA